MKKILKAVIPVFITWNCSKLKRNFSGEVTSSFSQKKGSFCWRGGRTLYAKEEYDVTSSNWKSNINTSRNKF